MESMIYFGKGVHTIMIRKSDYKVINTKRTSLSGILYYEFPATGIYHLVCIDNPTLSRINYKVENKLYAGMKKGYDSKLAGSDTGTVDITGTSPYYVADNTGTELEDAIAEGNFKVGDIFMDLSNMKWAPITDIDDVGHKITVEGGNMSTNTSTTWGIFRA